MSKVNNDVVFMDRGNYTSCTVHLHGGTILSYRFQNHEMLYMKQSTGFNKFSPIRGGIKFTFPYFGRRVNGPKHGFARYVPWIVEDGPRTTKDGDVEATFCLKETAYTKSIWNFQFKISYKLTLCMNCITMAVKIENTSKYFPFYFTIMRHSIFRVEDVLKVEVYGIADLKYISLINRPKLAEETDGGKFVVRRHLLDLFFDAPPVIEAKYISNKDLKLRITASDTSPEFLVYNPWIDPDPYESMHFPDEYKRCLGLGNGYLSKETRLEPQECWESFYTIEVVDETYEKKTDELAKLLDDPLQLFKNVCATADLIL